MDFEQQTAQHRTWKDCKKDPNVCTNGEPTLINLLSLMQNCSWQNLVNVSAQLLTNGHALLQDKAFCLVAALRFESLFRLKMYDDLNNELNSALDYYSEHNSIISDSLKVVCFVSSLKLLQCEVKLMTGRSFDALEQLTSIQIWLSQNINIHDTTYWRWQTSCHIINTNIRSRNWKKSIRLLRELVIDVDGCIASSKEKIDKVYFTFSKIILLLRITRILLQIGGLSSALSHFSGASALMEMLITSQFDCNCDGEVSYLTMLMKLTKGLILFAQEKFEEARDIFLAVMKDHTTLQTVCSTATLPIFCALYQSKDETPLAVAVNNFSICSLHLKNNLVAIDTIESLIEDDPIKFLCDSIVFNLCTMYDLSFSAESSLAMKKSLQKLATRYGISDPVLHWRSFRLS